MRNERARALPDEPVQVLEHFLQAEEAITPYHERFAAPPGYAFDMHYALEFGVVLSGCQRRLCGEWSAIVGPGEVWFQGVWEPHGVEVLELPTSCLVFAVDPQPFATGGLEKFTGYDWIAPFAAPPATRPRATPAAQQELLAVAQTLMPRVFAGGKQGSLWSWLCLLQMVSLAADGWVPPSRPQPPSLDSYRLLSRAIQLVFTSRYRASLRQAAGVCGLHPNALNRLFKARMGITFAKYCLRHRLSGGAGQLAHSTEPIKAIAREWGFADASHFHRCFQAQYGCTPTEYRDRHQLARAAGDGPDRDAPSDGQGSRAQSRRGKRPK